MRREHIDHSLSDLVAAATSEFCLLRVSDEAKNGVRLVDFRMAVNDAGTVVVRITYDVL